MSRSGQTGTVAHEFFRELCGFKALRLTEPRSVPN